MKKISIRIGSAIIFPFVGLGLAIQLSGTDMYSVASSIAQAFLSASMGYGAILIPIHQSYLKKENKPKVKWVISELLFFVIVSCVLLGISVAKVHYIFVLICYYFAVLVFCYVTWIVLSLYEKILK